jgi:NADH-quinone oxidoreductase subunit C
MGMINTKIDNINEILYIRDTFQKGLNLIVKDENLLYIDVDKKVLIPFLIFLKYNNLLKYEQLLDIWGLDYPANLRRFQINYLLVSIRYNKRIIIRVYVNENEFLDSTVELFKSAGWLEREVWDMFGVMFLGNKDLRRILTDYGFEGYPMRKDFPLTGYMECRYDDSDGRIALEPIELSQEYRVFYFVSPWDNEK